MAGKLETFVENAFYDEVKRKKARFVLDKLPTFIGNSVSFQVVSPDSDTFHLEAEDALKMIYRERGISLDNVECEKVPRWYFMSRVGEWEDRLHINLGYGIGDPNKPSQYVENLFALAEEMRASDIHLFITEGERGREGCIQLRIDGVLRTVDTLGLGEFRKVDDKVKSIDENAVRGKDLVIKVCYHTDKDHNTEYRVTSMSDGGNVQLAEPSQYVTAVRIIKRSFLQKPLNELGFLDHDILRIRELLNNTSGFFAIVGPTGSGKTTTAYAILNEFVKLTKGHKRVITFENPVESRIAGVTQIRVTDDPESTEALSYKEALENSLRLDPDFIFVGEALCSETGIYIADAAQTSHMYMMTMHAKDAPKAIGRLGGWNIGSRTLNDTLLGIVSLNLLRRNCPDCSIARSLRKDEIDYFFPKKDIPEGVYKGLIPALGKIKIKESPTGREDGTKEGKYCMTCQGTKYFGRVPIVEIYSHHLKQYGIVRKICENDETGDLEMRQLFRTGELEPMGLNALYHLIRGGTSPREVQENFDRRYFIEFAPVVAERVRRFIEKKVF